MASVLDNYPAVRYVDEAERDRSEECKACKGNCGYIGMVGIWACHGFVPKDAPTRTNAEKIRNMTNDELFEWFTDNCYKSVEGSCGMCEYRNEKYDFVPWKYELDKVIYCKFWKWLEEATTNGS